MTSQIVTKNVLRPIGLFPMQVNTYAYGKEFNYNMRNDRNNLIVDLTTKFALEIIAYSEILDSEKKYVIARQVLRSGTAIGANVWEAQNAESKADFIHKFKIAAKEADETSYWLTLCLQAKWYPDPDPELLPKLKDIKRIISKIISSSKNKITRSSQ